jgi:(2Fe-2S) ferredoxin
VSAPLLLVCAHGLHDVCCALRGRPVAAALAAPWPEATWECSHVGGDRFAANLVVLPDGVYYGNLDAGNAVPVVRAHLGGQVAVEHLRGMTRVPPAAQVAIAEVHRRYGPFGAADVEVSRVDHVDGRWRVALTTPLPRPSAVTVTISSSRRRSAQLTCRAPGDTPAMEYRVVSVTVEPG